MSIIGDFGICQKKIYNALLNTLETDLANEVEQLISEIQTEVEHTSTLLANDACSGEAFVALFEYLEAYYEINIRETTAMTLGMIWQERTGDYDFLAFSEQDKAKLMPISKEIDYDALNQFVSDFYQADYKEAGERACKDFFYNLGQVTADTVLVFRLY